MKCLSFAQAVNLPILGLIENMSGYVCPCCGEVSNVFSTGGGEAMAKREQLTFLGSLPVDTELVTLLDDASTISAASEDVSDQETPSSFKLLGRYKATPSSKLFVEGILTKILEKVSSREVTEAASTSS
ncbi:hypothetical protein MPER_14600 [Moniliophthora perniciosa FA553]|nr:hypothetical protein MPER_14600 [Moniliophthora perniciosa FA553]